MDDDSPAISQFGTGAADALSPLSPPAVPTGSDNSFNVAVTPNGTSAYVANGSLGSVSQYTINPTDGTLSAMSPQLSRPVQTTTTPQYRPTARVLTSPMQSTTLCPGPTSIHLPGRSRQRCPRLSLKGQYREASSLAQTVRMPPTSGALSRCIVTQQSRPSSRSQSIPYFQAGAGGPLLSLADAERRHRLTATARKMGVRISGLGEHHIDDRKRYELAAL